MKVRAASELLITCVFLLAASSALAQKVHVDSDSRADFSKYNTFKIVLQPGYTPRNPLMAQRAIKGVAYHLTLKGLREAGDSPDLSACLYAVLKDEKQLNIDSFGYGYGPYWGGWGGGMTTTRTYTITVGTLVVDLYDNNTKQLVWRGTGTDTLSAKPAKIEKKLNKALEKMFKKYPPSPH